MIIRAGHRDIAAAIFLFVVAFGVWGFTADVPRGTLRRMGPGFMPMLLIGLLSILGVIILIQGIAASRVPHNSDATPATNLSWRSVRNVVLVLGSIVLFAHGVTTLGLALTSFLVVVIAGQSTPELTWKQAIVAGFGFAIFCVLLFKFALNLSMPVFPW